MTDAADPNPGAGSSTGLSLREKLRLKAQEKLNTPAQSALSASRTVKSSSSAPRQYDSDDEALGSLTLGRSKRQAALKRPATYSIDPMDDATRLKRDPNKLPSLSTKLATPTSKSKGVESLLREKQRRVKRGTDADGFSRAEEIARSMEEERLERMGISDVYDSRSNAGESSRSGGTASNKVKPANGASFRQQSGNGEASELTVMALSPTIPSFLWSSQSEAAYSDDELEHATAEEHEQRLAASLAAAGSDEDLSRETLNLLQRDGRNRGNAEAPLHDGHIPFYRSERTLAPGMAPFCREPSIPSATQEPKAASPKDSSAAITDNTQDGIDTDEEDAWKTDDGSYTSIEPQILLACTLPPSLKLNTLQVRRVIVWTAVSYVLERDALQSRLRSALFQSLISDWQQSPYRKELETAVPRAFTKLLELVPHILHRIGVSPEVLEECFPDDVDDALNGLYPIVKRRSRDIPTSSPQIGFKSRDSRPRKQTLSRTSTRLYLTHAERDDIVTNLARTIDIVVTAAAPNTKDFVVTHLSLLAGYVSSMAVVCAATTNFTLQNQVGCAYRSIFTAATAAGEGVLRDLQSAISKRTFTALGMDSVPMRARLVSALPGEGRAIQAIRAWLGWCVLTEHLAALPLVGPAIRRVAMEDVVPSSDPVEAETDASEEAARIRKENVHWRRTPFEPWSIDLDMLARAVDVSDPRSPFFVASGSADTAAAAIRDHAGVRSSRSSSVLDSSRATNFQTLIAATQLLALVLRDLPLHFCSFSPTPSSSSAGSKWPRPLRLALAPYQSLNPQPDESRIATLRSTVERLAAVNSKIRDNRGDVILRTLAKDLLQRTAHSLEYQLEMYWPADGGIGSFIK